jgi:hypothetical protein
MGRLLVFAREFFIWRRQRNALGTLEWLSAGRTADPSLVVVTIDRPRL